MRSENKSPRSAVSSKLSMQSSLTVPSLILLLIVTFGASSIRAQDGPATKQGRSPDEVEEGKLQFDFGGTPWREVIQWLAEEGEFALHVSNMPTGSFTYYDPREFTPDEAIARINLFLLPEGFTLIRSGRLLSIIDLGDPRGLQQLDALAQNVTIDQLTELDDNEIAKCLFPLGELPAEDALEELSELNLMQTPSVFNRTNQLMITDLGSKLRTVKQILDAFEPTGLDNGTVVQNFALDHVDAEEILVVARPHLGLATGESIGIDVSVSSDPQGKNIFVTGVADKVKLMEDLIESLDRPDPSELSAAGAAELKSHLVQGGNVETVYNVLQTLLAGKPVRLSMDDTAGSIVALATPDVQEEIAATVEQLQASEAEFAVIPLKTIDPYQVVGLLEEMLDIPDPIFDDPEDEAYNHDAPKIDADPDNMRLFVTAKSHVIARIREIVSELDVDGPGGPQSDQIRLFPLRGKQVESVLETAAKFWTEDNLIILFPPLATTQNVAGERVVAEETAPANADVQSAAEDDSIGRVLAGDIRSQKAEIRCQPTPRGLLIQSEDTAALDLLFERLRTIAGPVDRTPLPPIVFYLKYTRPEVAIRMLAELLDGGDAAAEAGSGNLVNGYVSPGSSFLGSLVATRQGTMTMTAGTITVVADPRLNRLIAQGTAEDIERIEGYLKIIDKDTGITSVETYGRSRIIELKHSDANVVAATLRQAYGSRVAGVGESGQVNRQGNEGQDPRQRADARQQQGQRRESEEDERRGERPEDRRGQRGGNAGEGAAIQEPQMTIAVHEPSNSLIITAPEQLFEEVEALVRLIDTRNERVVEIIAIDDNEVIDALQSIFGGQSLEGGAGLESLFGPQPAQRSPRDTQPNRTRYPRTLNGAERFNRDR